jgi:hypothetical protein
MLYIDLHIVVVVKKKLYMQLTNSIEAQTVCLEAVNLGGKSRTRMPHCRMTTVAYM